MNVYIPGQPQAESALGFFFRALTDCVSVGPAVSGAVYLESSRSDWDRLEQLVAPVALSS